jgi:hypothetical protein
MEDGFSAELRHDILHLLGTSEFTRLATVPCAEPRKLSLHSHNLFLLRFISVLFPMQANMEHVGYLAWSHPVSYLSELNLADAVSQLHVHCCRQVVVCRQSSV